MIVALPNRREIDTLHALKDAGLAIKTIRGRHRSLNVAMPVPVLTNVVHLPRLRRRETLQGGAP